MVNPNRDTGNTRSIAITVSLNGKIITATTLDLIRIAQTALTQRYFARLLLFPTRFPERTTRQ